MPNTMPHLTIQMRVPLADVSPEAYSDEELEKMRLCLVDQMQALNHDHRRVSDELYRRQVAARPKRKTGEVAAANGHHDTPHQKKKQA